MNIRKIKKYELYEFKDISNLEDYIYYGIFIGNRLFGYIILNYSNELIVEEIYIKPEFRNSGYGSKLLNYSIYENINLKFDKVIFKKHKKIDNFLEKNGFNNVNNIYELTNVKEEIENIKTTLDLAKISLFINIFLSILKIFSGLIFKVNTLLADGINSTSDLINNILILIGANIDKEPIDEEHPFGHGKIASIFSLIIGVIIILTAFDIFIKSIINLIYHTNNSTKLGIIALIISIFSIVIKIFQYIFLEYYSKNKENQLLKTMKIDYFLDIIVSSVVFLGIILSKYIHYSFDAILAILITIYLIYQGFLIIKENVIILMDSQNKNLILNIKLLTLEVKEIKNIHDIYVIRVGNNLYITADIRLDENLTIKEAHDISVIAEKKIKYIYPNIKKIIYHIEPIYKEDEK